MYTGEDIKQQREAKANNIVKGFSNSDDLLEKARNHGDVHSNGKWYWESSANGGKGDWRTIKGAGKVAPHENTKNGDDGKITLSESKKAAIKQGISYIKGKFYSGRGDEMEPVLYNGNIRFQKYQPKVEEKKEDEEKR